MPQVPTKEKRRRTRFPLSAKVQIWWAREEGGGTLCEKASCLNISQTGIRLEMLKAPPLGALVHVEASVLQLSGSALVRQSSWKSGKYEVGLEFVGGLEWRVPRAV